MEIFDYLDEWHHPGIYFNKVNSKLRSSGLLLISFWRCLVLLIKHKITFLWRRSPVSQADVLLELTLSHITATFEAFISGCCKSSIKGWFWREEKGISGIRKIFWVVYFYTAYFLQKYFCIVFGLDFLKNIYFIITRSGIIFLKNWSINNEQGEL